MHSVFSTVKCLFPFMAQAVKKDYRPSLVYCYIPINFNSVSLLQEIGAHLGGSWKDEKFCNTGTFNYYTLSCQISTAQLLHTCSAKFPLLGILFLKAMDNMRA